MDGKRSLQESVGKNGGAIYSNGDGYWYRIKKKTKHSWRLSCHKDSCRGSAKILLKLPHRHLVQVAVHSCPANNNFPAVTKLRHRIMERAAKEMTPLSRIFFEETTRRDIEPEVASQLKLSSLASAMQKSRQGVRPPEPENTWDYISSMQEHEDKYLDIFGECFLSGVVDDGEGVAVIFIVKQLLKLLEGEGAELHMDNSFSCAPKTPELKLFTIIAIHQECAFPVVFCLMSKRTAELYSSIMNHLKEKIPKLAPQTIVSDYDFELMKAVSDSFPEQEGTIHTGSWFHYAQSIYKKILQLGLEELFTSNTLVKKATQMIISLALLPHEFIEEGMDCIESYFRMAEEISPIHLEKMDAFFRYVREYWLTKVGSEVFSIFMQRHRASNCQEAHHSRLSGLLGGNPRPSIWSFQWCLARIARNAITDALRLEKGEVIRHRKLKWLLEDKVIKELNKKLMAEPPKIGIFQFLSAAANRCLTKFPTESTEDGEEDCFAS
ncbi:uncharacterized protein LOC111058838 [Nilaparvata lugens]|uniref:uncharacterized protein LOC111058838 n=1 Tax=Nilaparvata lugens TaxID=108931 RepID=UPI00193E4730|nr:uncharacterized protein LOC111058838 [Nilaparvata lugens]